MKKRKKIIMASINKESDRVNAIKTFIDTLSLNGCVEIQKYLISASEARLTASIWMLYIDIDIEGFIDRGRFLCVVLFL